MTIFPNAPVEPPRLMAIASSAGGFTMWVYKTESWIEQGWRDAGFFDSASPQPRVGDLIVISLIGVEPLGDGRLAEVAFGKLAIVHRVQPHVVLHLLSAG